MPGFVIAYYPGQIRAILQLSKPFLITIKPQIRPETQTRFPNKFVAQFREKHPHCLVIAIGIYTQYINISPKRHNLSLFYKASAIPCRRWCTLTARR